MKMRYLTIVMAVVFATATTKAQNLTIDTESVKVEYVFLKGKVKGSVSGFEGKVNFKADNLESASISGNVDVSTLKSGIKMRDKHLKTATFFDVEKYPKMYFKSTEFEKNGDSYKMIGLLKIKDIEKEVEFTFTYSDKLFKATAHINSSDFGISARKSVESNKVDVVIYLPVK